MYHPCVVVICLQSVVHDCNEIDDYYYVAVATMSNDMHMVAMDDGEDMHMAMDDDANMHIVEGSMTVALHVVHNHSFVDHRVYLEMNWYSTVAADNESSNFYY